MAERTGQFGGFDFDPEVFSGLMEEERYWNNAILASGIIRSDATINSLIGSKGNVGTMPFYVPLDADADGMAPLNYDGKTDNVPVEIAGKKQSFMAIRRMKAFKEQDFTRELTGANPLNHVASSIGAYYRQVWEKVVLTIINAISQNKDLTNHVTDLTVGDGSAITITTPIEAKTKALGEKAGRFSLVVMNSVVYANLQKQNLIQFVTYNDADGLLKPTNFPTYNGDIVLVQDRGTVDYSGAKPVYTTYFLGKDLFLSSDVRIDNPYETARDPQSLGGINKLYTKQGYVLHPNGFSFKADNVAEESPSDAELGNKENWELRFNEKNIPLAVVKSIG